MMQLRLKSQRVLNTNESTTSEDSTAADTSPSEDSELEYLRNTQGQGVHPERVRQSLKLNTSLVQRALGTFSMSDPIKNREQGSIGSQASRITDSAQTTDKI